jgi:hypothetical protein
MRSTPPLQRLVAFLVARNSAFLAAHRKLSV